MAYGFEPYGSRPSPWAPEIVLSLKATNKIVSVLKISGNEGFFQGQTLLLRVRRGVAPCSALFWRNRMRVLRFLCSQGLASELWFDLRVYKPLTARCGSVPRGRGHGFFVRDFATVFCSWDFAGVISLSRFWELIFKRAGFDGRGAGGKKRNRQGLFFLLQGSLFPCQIELRAAVVAVVQDDAAAAVHLLQDAVCFGFGCCGDGY